MSIVHYKDVRYSFTKSTYSENWFLVNDDLNTHSLEGLMETLKVDAGMEVQTDRVKKIGRIIRRGPVPSELIAVSNIWIDLQIQIPWSIYVTMALAT